MPCSDPREHEESKFYEQEFQKLTVFLCEACQIMKLRGIAGDMSPGLADWSRKHDDFDKARQHDKT